MCRPFPACLVDELGDSEGLQGVQESQLVQACVRPHWTWMRKRQKHKSEKKTTSKRNNKTTITKQTKNNRSRANTCTQQTQTKLGTSRFVILKAVRALRLVQFSVTNSQTTSSSPTYLDQRVQQLQPFTRSDMLDLNTSCKINMRESFEILV